MPYEQLWDKDARITVRAEEWVGMLNDRDLLRQQLAEAQAKIERLKLASRTCRNCANACVDADACFMCYELDHWKALEGGG